MSENEVNETEAQEEVQDVATAAPEPEPEPEVAPAEAVPEPAATKAASSGFAGLPYAAWIGIAAALVIGLVLGFFVFGPQASKNAAPGAATVTEDKVDKAVVATYTYDGKEHEVTAAEVLENTGALEAYQNEDGSYRLPGAESTVAYVRNEVLIAEAEKRGITVSDEDIAAYAEEYIGTSDLALLAQTYGMSEESITSLLKSSLTIEKLRDQVMNENPAEGAVMPEEPPVPSSYMSSVTGDEVVEDGIDGMAEGDDEYADDEYADDEDADDEDADEADEENPEEAKAYAEYIINLAGDEWDAAAGTWVSLDGPYASALGSYVITNDSATYEAAQMAYYVAYSQYAEKEQSTAEKWEDFTNEIMSKVSITLYGLMA